MFSAIKRKAQWLRHSSLLRLTLIMSGIFALAILVMGIVTLFLVERQTMDQIDTELASAIENFGENDQGAQLSNILVLELSSLEQLPERFEDVDDDEVGYSTVDMDHGEGNWRVLLVPSNDRGWMFAAVSLSERDNAIEILQGVFVFTGFGALSIVLVFGIWLAFRAQSRLSKISKTLNALAAGNLQARTEIHQERDDIDLLARSLDQTADRLETLVVQTRNLGANIAHDLRTPLARLRANLEQAESGDENALTRASLELEQMSQVFDAIMRIARLEASAGKVNFSQTRLDTLALEMGDIFAPVAEDQGKVLEVDISNEARVSADRDLLVQVVANLVQNALVYGGDRITIFVKGTSLGVYDNGQGVAPELLDKLTQPMFRIDQTRQSQGAGLGLSMVKAVADHHNASLTIEANAPQGLKVFLNFANL